MAEMSSSSPSSSSALVWRGCVDEQLSPDTMRLESESLDQTYLPLLQKPGENILVRVLSAKHLEQAKVLPDGYVLIYGTEIETGKDVKFVNILVDNMTADEIQRVQNPQARFMLASNLTSEQIQNDAIPGTLL